MVKLLKALYRRKCLLKGILIVMLDVVKHVKSSSTLLFKSKRKKRNNSLIYAYRCLSGFLE